MSEISTTINLYGFECPTFVDSKVYQDYVDTYPTVLNRRLARWTKFNDLGKLVRGRELKRFCRKGIPLEFRVKVWLQLCGAEKLMQENPTVYKLSCEILPAENILHVIDADVPRTFPENAFFRNSLEADSKMKSLKNVLVALASHRPDIGYCQGFNYITATLMLAMPPSMPIDEMEEKTFWLLEALITRILPPYYSSDMIDTQVDCMVLEELLKEKQPTVYAHLAEASVSCVLLATKWFICVYADVLPIETVMRVFDALFYEGDKILFRTGIALVKLHSQRISTCTKFSDLIITFQKMCHDKETLFCHEFMKVMFDEIGSLSKKRIAKLRTIFRAQMEESARQVEERRKAQSNKPIHFSGASANGATSVTARQAQSPGNGAGESSRVSGVSGASTNKSE